MIRIDFYFSILFLGKPEFFFRTAIRLKMNDKVVEHRRFSKERLIVPLAEKPRKTSWCVKKAPFSLDEWRSLARLEFSVCSKCRVRRRVKSSPTNTRIIASSSHLFGGNKFTYAIA